MFNYRNGHFNLRLKHFQTIFRELHRDMASDVLALAWPESHGFGFQKFEAQPKPKPLL
jgi:hypothetical protein